MLAAHLSLVKWADFPKVSVKVDDAKYTLVTLLSKVRTIFLVSALLLPLVVFPLKLLQEEENPPPPPQKIQNRRVHLNKFFCRFRGPERGQK